MNTLSRIAQTLGLRQADVAKKVGYPSGTISKHFRAEHISPEAAIRYSAALGIPLSELRPDLPEPCLSPSTSFPEAQP